MTDDLLKIKMNLDAARRSALVMFSILMILAFFVSTSRADNAEVLPKGISKLTVNGKYYFPYHKKYGENGNEEELAKDFNANLNSTVFPDLALIEAAFGMPPGSASIGESVVHFEYELWDLIFLCQYGLTDLVSVGIKIPYYWNKNKVKASLDTKNATVGLNPAVPGGIAPLSVPGTKPFTKGDVLDLLGKGLDTNGDGSVDIPGFGYKPFETWDGSGLSDIEVGFRYQYLQTSNWRLAFTGGVRLPTGQQDDPDNLVDIGFGNGDYALLFNLNNDYVGIKNLVLDATFRYELNLPHKNYVRVPADANQPITTNKDRVHIDVGDVIELEGSATYEVLEGFSVSALYKYGFKFQDNVHGNENLSYGSLQEQTNYTEQVYIVGLSYSTIPLFRAGKFSIPFTATVFYRDRFAGSNLGKAQYLALELSFFF